MFCGGGLLATASQLTACLQCTRAVIGPYSYLHCDWLNFNTDTTHSLVEDDLPNSSPEEIHKLGAGRAKLRSI